MQEVRTHVNWRRKAYVVARKRALQSRQILELKGGLALAGSRADTPFLLSNSSYSNLQCNVFFLNPLI